MEKRFVYNALIKSVYDGDTLKVDMDLGFKVWLMDETVRVLGIDTPERRTRNQMEKKAGYAVTQFAQELLVPGQWVHIVSEVLDKSGRGKYGRILGDIVFSSPFVGLGSLRQLLIHIGYAKPYDGGTKSKWTDEELLHIVTSEIHRIDDGVKAINWRGLNKEETNGE